MNEEKLLEILNKLRERSQKNNLPIPIINLHFLFERFLYRLSLSKYNKNFVLKGGLLFYSYHVESERITRDIDLSVHDITYSKKTRKEMIKQIIIEICNIKVDDCISFDVDSIEAKTLGSSSLEYKIVGYIGSDIGETIKIDISLSNISLSDSLKEKELIKHDFPSLIGMKSPKIIINSIELLIAQKFEGIIRRSITNTRMRDFYDLYKIINATSLTSKNINGFLLMKSLIKEFKISKIYFGIEKDNIFFSETFIMNENLNEQWQIFLADYPPMELNFRDVIEQIQLFFKPIYENLINNEEFHYIWNSKLKQWQKK